MELKEIVKELGEISKKIYEIYNDDEKLVNALNLISEKAKIVLNKRYANSDNRPVNQLRFELIQKLINDKITLEVFYEIIKKHRIKNSRKLESWKHNFKIFHPLILEDINDKIYKLLEIFIENIYSETDSLDKLNFNWVDFKGAQQQGYDRIWIAFYNKNMPSQSSSKQFFIEFLDDKIKYGLYTHFNEIYITDKIELNYNNFDEIKFYNYLKKYLNILIDDIPTENQKKLKELLKIYKENELYIYFSILKYILLKNNIQKLDNKLSFACYPLKLSFFVGKKGFLELSSNGKFSVLSNNKKLSKKYIDEIIENLEDINKQFKIEFNKKGKSNRRKENNSVFEDFIFEDVMKDNNYNLDLETSESNNEIAPQEPDNQVQNCTFPKNQILYGPPGTGKTYNTVRLAVQILNCLEELPNYENAIIEYNRLKKEGRLSFVTFHQNFSYEDFVQGLRPDLNSDGMQFIKHNGIFKEIADKAKENIIESLKKPDELSERDSFLKSMEDLKERITENDENVKISNSAYLYSVEEDAFRYTGENWTLNDKGFNGFRMRYNDLLEIFDNKVNERKQIKELRNISGLAKQHATYFFNTYKMLKDDMTPIIKDINSVEKQSYVLIIDEINRANISRVFGELITLIEDDKRWDGGVDDNKVKWEVTLPSGAPFVVSDNLYIIGTMNTADKSIALLDVALRRRFVFRGYYPDSSLVHPTYKTYFESLNKLIVKELGEGRGHDLQIGHSYFMTEKDEKGNFKDLDFISVMNNKVIPLLLEYFMNNVEDVRKLVSESLNEIEFQLKKDSYPLEFEIKTESKGAITEAKEVTE